MFFGLNSARRSSGAALIQINRQPSGMRKIPISSGRPRGRWSAPGSHDTFENKPGRCGRARHAQPMISTPWLARTALIKVIRLRANRIPCSRSMSPKVVSGRTLARAQPSIEEQRLGDKLHQCKQQPHCHHRVHPPICQRAKTVPQIEPDDHVEAGASGKHRRDDRARSGSTLGRGDW